MGQTLQEIAQQLKASNKKVQLIYAFNGTGKTRLSREFRQLIAPKTYADDDAAQTELARKKILYYSAFTEDLFYWNNDLAFDTEPKLKIQPNTFTEWVLKDQGQDQNMITYFQHYTNDKLTPKFSEDFSEVAFSFQRGNENQAENIKISKGEESNFVWSIFYSLLQEVVNVLNMSEVTDRLTDQFDELEYIFIDDPVSSLDENHLIQLAVDLAQLIKSSNSHLKFILSTHNTIFYNVLHNELKTKVCYMLGRLDDGKFSLQEKHGDSNKSFSYHLHLKNILEQAIQDQMVERYHFTLLRNLYEKAASFLGYPNWSELLPDDKQAYLNRIIQFTSHSSLSIEAVSEPSPQEKQTIRLLLEHLVDNYSFWKERT